jgi:hypothetical protein
VSSAPVASSTASLYDLQAELLQVAADLLDQLPAGAPDRQYVAHGLPAIDCEQLTVHAYQVGEASTDPADQPLARFRRDVTYPRQTLVFCVITVVRCYPGPTGDSQPPAVADLAAAEQTISADGWVLWNGIPRAIREGELTLWRAESFTSWEALQPLGPMGELAGWTMGLQTRLDGFDPLLPA